MPALGAPEGLSPRGAASTALRAALQQLIELALDELPGASEELGDPVSWVSYTDAGVLTSDEGILLHLTDGSEFQITIVQSR